MPATRPPRLVVRSLLTAFAAILVVLCLIFVFLAAEARERAVRQVADNLEAGRQAFSRLEARRVAELTDAATRAVAAPSLVAAMRGRHGVGGSGTAWPRAARDAAARTVHDLADGVRADAVAIVDRSGRVVASAGRFAPNWVVGRVVGHDRPRPGRGQSEASGPGAGAPPGEWLWRPGGDASFRVMSFPLVAGREAVGELQVARVVDQGYAAAISGFLRGHTAVVGAGHVLASNLPASQRALLDRLVGALPATGVVDLGGEPHAVKEVLDTGGVRVFALDSVREASRGSLNASLRVLGALGVAAMLMAAFASFWLARSISRPIGELSHTIDAAASARRFETRIPRTGASREVDALADTFNHLMGALRDAETERRMAYVGAIKALAAALDARDPNTAGHSERVSLVAVAVGRQLGLAEPDLDVLRLGALLHDIGKIGVSDHVLRKPGPLTEEEMAAIREHPRLGARILAPVAFLAPHLPIVELHHERPDGTGYPHGLRGDDIPVHARVVRVADAFDAMTSARAYRPARHPDVALAELQRGAGAEFDADVVAAMSRAWPDLGLGPLTSGRRPPDTAQLGAMVG